MSKQHTLKTKRQQHAAEQRVINVILAPISWYARVTNKKSHLSRVIHFHQMPVKFRSLEFRDWIARLKMAYNQVKSSKADAGHCLQVNYSSKISLNCCSIELKWHKLYVAQSTSIMFFKFLTAY